ncbi:MAG: DNA mismatch repair protein MutS, partial [Bacteroidales bacterium]
IDDIELFEIKYLSILSEDVRNILSKALLKSIVLPVLEDVVNILDPDGLKISSFYVYDVYSAELREVRRKIKVINTTLEVNLNEQDITLQEQLQELTQRMLEIEIDVRRELSGKLRGYVVMLDSALKGLAKLDILFAKGLQIKEMGLCFPSVSMDCKTSYKGLFHPQIKDVLEKQGKFFTPINIEFALEPVTIIGANMGGKTVVLKMAALSQLLFQFGFGIPAQNACVDIKNSVLLCIGDEQNELSGLSSFAAEVKAIDNVLCCVKRGERILALIDEPARTTNPVEGTALVSALLKVLYKKEVSVLLTTHYNIGGDFYKRFRVRGFINNVMDY